MSFCPGSTTAGNESDIDQAISHIREAVRPFPKAALFELAEEGFRSPFEQLIACIISVRTLDEVSEGATDPRHRSPHRQGT